MPHQMRIRLGRAADAMHIAQMSRDFIESGLGWSWTQARVLANIRHADTTVAVAATVTRVHAFAIMYFGATHAHLNLLAVRPEYQRAGFGRRLVQWLEASAEVAGCFTVYLEVRASNSTGRRFYRALGYHDVGYLPGYYCGRESAVRMAHDFRCVSSRDAAL
jgi:ribosomal-protein-alanine N-acetyltransferase